MPIKSCRKLIKFTSTVLFILIISTSLFAQGTELEKGGNRGYIVNRSLPEIKKDSAPNVPSEIEENLSALQKQARLYRAQGLEFQRMGNLEEAKVFYQKAIRLDPAYAAVYNDLGVIAEADGLIDLTEEYYLKAIKLAPNFLSPYSNLGLLYEKKGDLEKAILYWNKRAELGLSKDPWTEKARQHAQALSQILEQPGKHVEVANLIKDVRAQKHIESQNDKELAKAYFKNARLSYEKQDLVVALKQAVDASLLDPSNREIEEFIVKVQTRLLSR